MPWIKEPAPQNLSMVTEPPCTRQFLAYLSCKRADEIVVEEAIPLPDLLATWGAPWNPLCGKY